MSLFGGTPFASAKVSLKTILTVVSIIQHSKGDIKILRIAKSHEWNYKTAYYLFCKASEMLVRGIEGQSSFIGAMSTRGARYGQQDRFRSKIDQPKQRLTQPQLQQKILQERAPDAPAVTRSVIQLLKKPRYLGGFLLATHSMWTQQEKLDLRTLAVAGATPEEAGLALGRSASSIAWRSKDIIPYTLIPQSWKRLFLPNRPLVPAAPRLLFYPYLPDLPKLSGAQLTVDVSALVSRAYPDFMRADICQTVLLAILEGKTALNDLRGSPDVLRTFVRSYRKEQQDPYTVSSLDAPRWTDGEQDSYGSTLPTGVMNRLEW